MKKSIKYNNESITVHYQKCHQKHLFGTEETVYNIGKIIDTNGVEIIDLTDEDIVNIQKLLIDFK